MNINIHAIFSRTLFILLAGSLLSVGVGNSSGLNRAEAAVVDPLAITVQCGWNAQSPIYGGTNQTLVLTFPANCLSMYDNLKVYVDTSSNINVSINGATPVIAGSSWLNLNITDITLEFTLTLTMVDPTLGGHIAINDVQGISTNFGVYLNPPNLTSASPNPAAAPSPSSLGSLTLQGDNLLNVSSVEFVSYIPSYDQCFITPSTKTTTSLTLTLSGATCYYTSRTTITPGSYEVYALNGGYSNSVSLTVGDAVSKPDHVFSGIVSDTQILGTHSNTYTVLTTVDGDGSLIYSESSTGCSVGPSTGVVTITNSGDCLITVGTTGSTNYTDTATTLFTLHVNNPAAIRISKISENHSGIRGGEELVITGTGFTSGATVTLGGMSAQILKRTGTTRIMVRIPAHALGVVSVVITNPDSGFATIGGFTYKRNSN